MTNRMSRDGDSEFSGSGCCKEGENSFWFLYRGTASGPSPHTQILSARASRTCRKTSEPAQCPGRTWRKGRSAAWKVSAPTADQVISSGPVGTTCFLMSFLARLAVTMASFVASPLPLKRDEQGRIFTPPYWSARMQSSPRFSGARNDEGCSIWEVPTNRDRWGSGTHWT